MLEELKKHVQELLLYDLFTLNVAIWAKSELENVEEYAQKFKEEILLLALFNQCAHGLATFLKAPT